MLVFLIEQLKLSFLYIMVTICKVFRLLWSHIVMTATYLSWQLSLLCPTFFHQRMCFLTLHQLRNYMRVAAVPLLKNEISRVSWLKTCPRSYNYHGDGEWGKEAGEGLSDSRYEREETSLHCHILSFTIWDCKPIKPCYAARPVVLFSEMWLRWEIPDPVVEM